MNFKRFNAHATVSALIAAAVLSACSPGASPSSVSQLETATNVDEQAAMLSPSESRAGLQVYVSGDDVSARPSPNGGDSLGSVNRGDRVTIVDPARNGPNELIAVQVVSTSGDAPVGRTVYVAARFLSASPVAAVAGANQGPGSLFVITNVATEMIRVYRRCQDGEGCINKMIFETRGTNGQPSRQDTRTDVGSYNITRWVKFYEIPGQYPAWWRPEYPPLPRPRDRQAWFNEARPAGFQYARGAFGWFTAMVGPNPNGQWFHGTLGWGSEGRFYVDFKSTFLGGLAATFGIMTRSHGCTSMDNPSIAYMRSHLPAGTTYIKVYAKEALRDASLAGYPGASDLGRYDYILTQNGYGRDGEAPGRENVLGNGTPESQWLEQGTLAYDQHPDVRRGDLYRVGSSNFQGQFLIDQGLLENYAPPTSVTIGGRKNGRGESVFPSFIIAQ